MMKYLSSNTSCFIVCEATLRQTHSSIQCVKGTNQQQTYLADRRNINKFRVYL